MYLLTKSSYSLSIVVYAFALSFTPSCGLLQVAGLQTRFILLNALPFCYFSPKPNTAYHHSRKLDVLIKNSQINSRKIVPCADDQTTQTNFIQFHFRDSRFFMLSFAATLCLFFIIKVTFLFFSDNFLREYCSV